MVLIFRKKKIEVLLLSDRIDEWMSSHLNEFEGKTLKSVSKGNLDLEEELSTSKKDTDKSKENIDDSIKNILDQMKKILSDNVEDVRISKRLTNSPSCIVVNTYGMSLHLQKMMSDAGQTMQNMNGGKPILEINCNHKIIKKLKNEQDDDVFKDWTNILYQQAMLIEGAKLEDPAGFIKLINQYLS